MRKPDRFLIAIVAGVVLLVVMVFVIAQTQSGRPSYQPDDAPESVVHNYLLALQLEDYERAYGYLSPGLPGHPADAEEFRGDIRNHQGRFSDLDDDISLAVESVKIIGDEARVSVRRTRFHEGGLFDSGQYTSDFDMTLRRTDDGWKISESDSFWVRCWSDPDSSGCP